MANRFISGLRRVFQMNDAATYRTAGTGQRSLRWRGSGIGPNAAVESGGQTIRNQSRDLLRKNPIAASAVGRLVSNTVGTGIKPQWPSAEVNQLWKVWTDQADAHGVQDFYGLQAQIMTGVVTGGEVFVRHRQRRASDGLIVPYQLEVLEAEFVPMEHNEMRPNGNVVRMGIEFDRNIRSRRVAYWMKQKHPDDGGLNIVEESKTVRVPASEVMHVFLPERPGQVRGEPWLHRVLAKLHDIDGYDTAEVIRKKTTSLFAGFIKRAIPSTADVTRDELEAWWGTDVEINSVGVADVTFEPGTMQYLAPGEDVEFSNPPDVGQMYEVFMRVQQREIAAALGILYEQLSGDYSQVNDRTWRAAMNDFKRRVEQWQWNLMVFQFCRPVALRFAETAVLAGAAKQPGAAPSAEPLPLQPTAWTPPRWPYINPLQDVQAMKEEILAGITSRQRTVSERGDNIEEIDKEIGADNRRAKDLRLSSDGTVANEEAPEPAPFGGDGPPPPPKPNGAGRPAPKPN